jgi:hypothetical protein
LRVPPPWRVAAVSEPDLLDQGAESHVPDQAIDQTAIFGEPTFARGYSLGQIWFILN